MTCVPLGDQSVLVYLPDEPAAVRFAAAVRAAAPPWLQDVVPAYASVGVFFDTDAIGLGGVIEWLKASGGHEPPEFTSDAPATSDVTRGAHAPRSPRLHRVPVCYELQ